MTAPVCADLFCGRGGLSTGLLNAGIDVRVGVDYGVCQMRKRLFVVGTRGRGPIPMPPKPTHAPGENGRSPTSPPTTCCTTCRMSRRPRPKWSPTTSRRSLEGDARGLRAVGTREPKSRHDRLRPERPSYTLRAGTGNFSALRPVHYEHDRVRTVRECTACSRSRTTSIGRTSKPAYSSTGRWATPSRLCFRTRSANTSPTSWGGRWTSLEGPPDCVKLTLAERISVGRDSCGAGRRERPSTR